MAMNGEIMKIAVISNETGFERDFVYSNLVEVLMDSKSMECVRTGEQTKAIIEGEYCVLVSGVSDKSLEMLKSLIKSVEEYGKAYGVLIYKSDEVQNEVLEYCQLNQIKVLETIMNDDLIVKSMEDGQVISCDHEDYRMKFLTVLNNIYVHMANMIFKLKAEGAGGCGGH